MKISEIEVGKVYLDKSGRHRKVTEISEHPYYGYGDRDVKYFFEDDLDQQERKILLSSFAKAVKRVVLKIIPKVGHVYECRSGWGEADLYILVLDVHRKVIRYCPCNKQGQPLDDWEEPRRTDLDGFRDEIIQEIGEACVFKKQAHEEVTQENKPKTTSNPMFDGDCIEEMMCLDNRTFEGFKELVLSTPTYGHLVDLVTVEEIRRKHPNEWGDILYYYGEKSYADLNRLANLIEDNRLKAFLAIIGKLK